MANQPPPARPWFRLASIARPPPPPTPTPAPEPPPPQPRPRGPTLGRPPFRVAQPQPTQPQEPTLQPRPPAAASPPAPVLPATGVASVPTSPTPKAPAPSYSLPPPPPPPPTPSSVPSSPKTRAVPPTASLPSSPAVKPSPTSTSVSTSPPPKAVTATETSVLSTAASPRATKPTVQTPHQSPKPKPTAPPPSPLILPPSQEKSFAEPEPKIPLIAEQKTVLVQKTIDKPKPRQIGSDSQKDFIDNLSSRIALLAKEEQHKIVETKGKGHHKKGTSDSEEMGMRVITIAGENKGAFMEVFHSPKKHVFEGNPQFLHSKENSKSDGKEWKSHSSSSSSSGSEEGNSKKDKSRKGKAMGTSPLSAFMNSNVQGVNSSIVFKSSCTHRDPGVHLALSRKAAGGGFHIKDHGKN